jgi:hypothetical protein
VVRYLLDAGISPHVIGTCSGTRAFAEACINGRLDVAKLLRSFGAKLQMSYEEQVDPRQPSGMLLGFASKSNEICEWLRSRPPEGHYSAYLYRPPDEGEEFSAVSRDRIPKKLIHLVERWQDARRREVKDRTRHNWKLVRNHVIFQSAVFYWMGETQKRVCAPGGKGRTADKKYFEWDFPDEEAEDDDEKNDWATAQSKRQKVVCRECNKAVPSKETYSGGLCIWCACPFGTNPFDLAPDGFCRD